MSNPTSNFLWQMPTAVDLVTDLPADFEVFGQAVDTSLADLKGGTAGQILAKNTNADMDFVWITNDVGDITAVNAGTGLTGGGTSGSVTLTLDTSLTGLTTITTSADSTINGIKIGLGGGGLSTNTMVGKTVLQSNTTGEYNTGVGMEALNANTTGNYNTAVGRQTLYSNTTGSSNVAMGLNALDLNTTGSDNTAIGQNALGANVNGNGNVAIGSDTGLSITSGTNNIAVGRNALRSTTTATDNCAFGVDALYSNTTGLYNVALGQDAGNFGVGNTTGSNNVFIGFRAAGSSATVSNTVTLGNSSIATLRCQQTSITSLSDARDKTDIAPLEHGLDFVKQLKPVSFEWNMRPETYTDQDGNEIEIQGKVGIADIGFIAQDIVALEDSLGDADSLRLSYRDNPEKLEVTQGRLIPILVKAIQDLTAKVEALEAEQA